MSLKFSVYNASIISQDKYLFVSVVIRRMLFKAIGIVNSVKAVCVSNMYRFYDFYLFFQYFSCYLPSTHILYNDYIQSINIILTALPVAETFVCQKMN